MPENHDPFRQWAHPEFTRSAKYDPQWAFDHSMGPNSLWLAEWLTNDMALREKMTILDMGCGMAITSVFLAKEFDCTVFANDLWIDPSDNMKRVTEAGEERRIFPMRCEAHSLPYANGLFDSILCIDSYTYFGTDDHYLQYLLQFLKPGGELGIVVAGLAKDFENGVPDHLKPFWSAEWTSVAHTLGWWQHQWARTGLVEITTADVLENSCQTWLDSTKAKLHAIRSRLEAAGATEEAIAQEQAMWKKEKAFLEADRGQYFCLMRMVARKPTAF